MYLLYRFFNSVIFMLVNLMVAMYTCRRFFALMRFHYKLVAEIGHFNGIVRQSRLSLDYMNDKVSEAMKEIEGDIGKELYLTHNLTKISSKMAIILRRFNALEEGVIELVRMDYNMESIKIETPSDINTEVKKILKAAKKQEIEPMPERTKTPKKLKNSTTSFMGNKDLSTMQQNPVSKFSAVKPTMIRSKSDFLESSISALPTKGQNLTKNSRELTPTAIKLLSEKRHDSMSKTIGFRPSWRCEA